MNPTKAPYPQVALTDVKDAFYAGLYATRASKHNPFLTKNDLANPKVPIGLIDGATITWDAGKNYNAYVTLGGDRTLVVTGVQKGDYGTIKIIQDSVGGRMLTLPAGSKVGNNQSGILPLDGTPNSYDIATFYCDENGVLNFTITPNFT